MIFSIITFCVELRTGFSHAIDPRPANSDFSAAFFSISIENRVLLLGGFSAILGLENGRFLTVWGSSCSLYTSTLTFDAIAENLRTCKDSSKRYGDWLILTT